MGNENPTIKTYATELTQGTKLYPDAVRFLENFLKDYSPENAQATVAMMEEVEKLREENKKLTKIMNSESAMKITLLDQNFVNGRTSVRVVTTSEELKESLKESGLDIVTVDVELPRPKRGVDMLTPVRLGEKVTINDKKYYSIKAIDALEEDIRTLLKQRESLEKTLGVKVTELEIPDAMPELSSHCEGNIEKTIEETKEELKVFGIFGRTFKKLFKKS